MRTILITGDRHKGKQINITKYKKTASGVEIEATHNVPATPGKQLRWVQTVTENGSYYRACGRRTAVDPFSSIGFVALPGVGGVCKADDLKPFYWTDAEFSGGSGPFFDDKATERKPATGRTWIQFVLALTEVSGTNVHHLVAISWGFDRMANGLVKVAAIRRANVIEVKRHNIALKQMYSSYTYTY